MMAFNENELWTISNRDGYWTPRPPHTPDTCSEPPQFDTIMQVRVHYCARRHVLIDHAALQGIRSAAVQTLTSSRSRWTSTTSQVHPSRRRQGRRSSTNVDEHPLASQTSLILTHLCRPDCDYTYLYPRAGISTGKRRLNALIRRVFRRAG